MIRIMIPRSLITGEIADTINGHDDMHAHEFKIRRVHICSSEKKPQLDLLMMYKQELQLMLQGKGSLSKTDFSMRKCKQRITNQILLVIPFMAELLQLSLKSVYKGHMSKAV